MEGLNLRCYILGVREVAHLWNRPLIPEMGSESLADSAAHLLVMQAFVMFGFVWHGISSLSSSSS